MPGPSSGVPMNSMPAASRAAFMALILGFVLFGIPVSDSILLIVLTLTPLSLDSSSALSFTPWRAERI